MGNDTPLKVQLNWFPCVHEVGFKTVNFKQRIEEQPREQQQMIRVEGPVEEIEDDGSWVELFSRCINPMTKINQKNKWHKDAESISAFIETLATEILYISKDRFPFTQLAVTLSSWYEKYLQSREGPKKDTVEGRSDFRIEWWFMAEYHCVKLI
jgi:hypothetical protein